MHQDLWYVIPVTMLVAVAWYGWAVDPAYREALTGLTRIIIGIIAVVIAPAALIVWIAERVDSDRHE